MDYLDAVGENIVQADMYLKDIIYKLAPLYKVEHGEYQDVMVPFFTALHSTSESILVLLSNQALFDADILLRTVMEGTIKYCYLLNGTDEEKRQKYEEYKVQLSDIDKITDHRKAVEAVEILKKFSHNSTKPFECSILEDDELQKLLIEYPQKKRNALKQKWSYQSMLRSLALENQEYEAQIGTLSTYALTSHFCHYDWTGLSTRNRQIMDSVNSEGIFFDILHCNRIVLNVLSLELFRVMEYMRGNRFYSKEIKELYVEIYNYILQLDKNNNDSFK